MVLTENHIFETQNCQCQQMQGRIELATVNYVPQFSFPYQYSKPREQQSTLQLQKIKKTINLIRQSLLDNHQEMIQALEEVEVEVKLLEEACS